MISAFQASFVPLPELFASKPRAAPLVPKLRGGATAGFPLTGGELGNGGASTERGPLEMNGYSIDVHGGSNEGVVHVGGRAICNLP
jgi:hypothetical protein